MPKKLDPEVKAYKKEMAEYMKTSEFKEKMKAIKIQVAAHGVANKKLSNSK